MVRVLRFASIQRALQLNLDGGSRTDISHACWLDRENLVLSMLTGRMRAIQ
jgi:hypothetical protein